MEPRTRPRHRIAVAVGLRPWSVDDAEALACMYRAARAELAGEEPWRDDAFFTAAGQLERIESCTGSDSVAGFVITGGEAIVGSLSLDQIRRDILQSADIGYWVDPRHRGRGVATAAIGLAARHAFSTLRLHRVHATVDLANLASWRALERSGFHRVGVVRDFAFVRGAWRDHYLYQRTADAAETASG